MMSTVTRVRNIRAESNIDPSRKVELLVKTDLVRPRRILEAQVQLIQTLAQVSRVRFVEEIPAGLPAARGVVTGVELVIPLADALNLEEERRRLAREIEKVDRELEATRRKLETESFVARAPSEIVEKVRSAHRDLLERKTKLTRTLADLQPPGVSPHAR